VTATITERSADGTALGPALVCTVSGSAAPTPPCGPALRLRRDGVGEDGQPAKEFVFVKEVTDTDGDGVVDDATASVEVTLKGDLGAATVTSDVPVYTAQADGVLTETVPAEDGAPWTWTATLFDADGSVAGVAGGQFTKVEQFGEILIDGVVWELE
jgi:hypothetical protein